MRDAGSHRGDSVGASAPLRVRVSMAHGVLAHLAARAGVDVLHIKGVAIDPELARPGRTGTDADVLIRPHHLARMQIAMAVNGWELTSSFTWGSPFGHAATYHHALWGYADIHRHFPGVTAEPEAAFARLWCDRGVRAIAAVPCGVPSVPGQILILVLNAARSAGTQSRQGDVELAWEAASADRRAEVVDLVSELGAEVAFAAGIGELARFRRRREYDLWRVASQGGTRIEEWAARIKAAPTVRERVRIALRAPMVNRDHLTVRLGRRPTRPEVVREFFARPARGVVEESRATARRLRDDS